jgi:hypothetical protein
MSGYLHPDYTLALAEYGSPRELPRSKGWILCRQITGFPYQDAMGCYPLFTCENWSRLHGDLENLRNELVCLSLVADPFGEYELNDLRRCFEHKFMPFKEHFIVDLGQEMQRYVSNHHRRYSRKALAGLQVQKCEKPILYIDDWVGLYTELIRRHNIKGILAFSRNVFKRQLQVPGLVMFRAMHQQTTIGMLLWYVHGQKGYYHLGAFNIRGYELHASFALFWFSIEYFTKQGLRFLTLGGGAGVTSPGDDGLSQFKRGWATGTKTAYFCGRIFDHAKYSEIVKAKGITSTDYFPAYRKGEFE